LESEKAQSTIKNRLGAILLAKNTDIKSDLNVTRTSIESLKQASSPVLTKEGFTTEFIEAEGENRPLFISDFPVDDERVEGQFFDFYFSMDTNQWLKFDLQDALATS
jgi:hypothetical protein